MRKFLGIVFGLVVGYVVISGIQWLGHKIYPLPEGTEGLELEELTDILNTYIKNAPIMALVFIMLSHIWGMFLAVFTAMKISKGYEISASIVGGLYLILTIATLFMLSHPIWMIISDLLFVFLSAMFAIKLAKRNNHG